MIYLFSNKLDFNEILPTVLKKRGVEDIEKYMNPSAEDEIHYSKLKNMNKAVELFKKHMNQNSRVIIVTDRDADGVTSSVIMHKYIEDHVPQLDVVNIQHPKRENGLTEHMMISIKELTDSYTIEQTQLVILPDASSNDKEQHEFLNSKGIDVLVLDHHEVHTLPTDNVDTVVVNPQLSPDYSNKQISGVGVTYKFLQALDDSLGLNGSEDNIELVALGNVSDSMDIREPETRSIVVRGLENVENSFMKALIEKFKDGRVPLNPHSLSWTVLPKFNALIRVGTVEELQFVYEAMLGREGTFENPRARTEKNRIETWQEKAVRLCNNAYGKQRRMRTKLVDQVTEFIDENKLDRFNIIIAPMKDLDSQGLTGYVAGQLVNNYKKPVVLMNYDEETEMYSGSLRGLESVIEDLKGYLESTGLFELLAGHSSAAGAVIHKDNIVPLLKRIAKDIEYNVTVEYDFEIDYSEVTPELISHVDSLSNYWGKNVEPPMFAIKNTDIPMEYFEYKPNVSRVKNRGHELMMFSTPDILQKHAKKDVVVKGTVYGELSINRFFNNVTDQIKVEEFVAEEIVEQSDEDMFDFLF